MPIAPVPSVPLPGTRRRVVYRNGSYSAVHCFRNGAAHLQA
ncbi:hypothetical protein [Streptomyces sp. NPDC059979]